MYLESPAMVSMDPAHSRLHQSNQCDTVYAMHAPYFAKSLRKEQPNATTTQLLVYLKSLTHVLPRANTTPRPSLLYTFPMVYNFNHRWLHVSILCHILRQPHTLHIASNNLVTTHHRTSSPSHTMQKVNRLTPPHRCIYTPPLNMSKSSQSSLPQLVFQRCNSYFLIDHHIFNPIQSSITTHLLYHSHLNYHQPLDLGLLDWLILYSIK